MAFTVILYRNDLIIIISIRTKCINTKTREKTKEKQKWHHCKLQQSAKTEMSTKN